MKPRLRVASRIVAAFVLAATLTACASVKPGSDAILVRAQQTYATAENSFDLLFKLEYDNRVLLESKLPGTHALVNTIKVQAREYLPRLLRAIDAYTGAKTAANGNELVTILSVIEDLLRQAQEVLAKSQPALAVPAKKSGILEWTRFAAIYRDDLGYR